MAASICSECKGEFAASELVPIKGRYVCGGCKPIVLQKISEGIPEFIKHEVAGYGSRVLAYFLDALIVMSICFLIGVMFGAMHFEVLAGIVAQVFSWFYYLYFVVRSGQTPGKMIAKIKIINLDGSEQISYGKAIGRQFAYILDMLTLGIGLLMPLWDKEYGRALHDRICSTRVIKVKK